jgi:hypothetical protein
MSQKGGMNGGIDRGDGWNEVREWTLSVSTLTEIDWAHACRVLA